MQIKLSKKQTEIYNEIITSELFDFIQSTKFYEIIKYSPKPIPIKDDLSKFGSIDDPNYISYELKGVSYDRFVDLLKHVKIIVFDNLIKTKYTEASDVFFIDDNGDVISKCQIKPTYYKQFKKELGYLFNRIDEITTINMLKGFIDYYKNLTGLSLSLFDDIDELVVRQDTIVGESIAFFVSKNEAKKYMLKANVAKDETIELRECKTIQNAFKILSLLREDKNV